MTMRPTSVLREAWASVRARHVLSQIGLVALVAGLAVLWLHIPDASAIDVVGSVLLGLLVVWVAGAGETALFLRLCGMARTRKRLLLGVVMMLVGVGLWIWARSWIEHLERGDYLRAGYLNSRVSFRWRNVFSFDHIIVWLGWMWTAIEWMVAGAIAGFVFPVMASARPVRAVFRVVRSITYWVVLVTGATAASAVTGLLMGWTPGHGLRTEAVSLGMRLGLAVIVDCWVAVLVLAVLAVCLKRSDTA